MTDLLLFVSHASSDADLARAVVVAVEQALKVSARRIRCTSLDGYRLPAGARTSDVLRQEILGSGAFLALLTPRSVESSYVMFELGARWGASKQVVPLLARDVDPRSIPSPLDEVNCLALTEKGQVLQLLEDLAAVLSLPLEPYASFAGAVERVVASANPAAGGPPRPPRIARIDPVTMGGRPADPEEEFRQLATAKMKAGLRMRSTETYVSVLATMAGISLENAIKFLRVDPDVGFSGSGSMMKAFFLPVGK
jgi:hypothetical protein